MQIAEKLNEGLKREYHITVPAKQIEEQINTRLEEIGKEVQMPGFRPGKAPITLLKQKYGPSIMGEVLDITVRSSTSKAIEEKKLRAAGQPKIEIDDFGEGKDLKFKLSIEVLPEFKLMELSKLKLEKMKVPVSEEEVDSALKTLAQRNPATKEVSRAAQKGDHVTLDFLGKVDGVAFQGGEAKGYTLVLGSGTFLPDFEKHVEGFKVGETRDIPVGFPAEYHSPDLAGKTAQFTITVHKIAEEIPGQVDDALAKNLGFESLKDLQEAAKTQIDREFTNVARDRLKRELFDMLADKHDFDLPPGLVDGEFENIWDQYKRAKEAGNLDPDDASKSEDEMKVSLRDIAERRVRLGLVIAEIGNVNKIDVSDDELRRAIMAEAGRFPGQEDKILNYFRQNPQAIGNIRAPLVEDKVVDYILEIADVTEKPATKDELFAPVETPSKEGKKSAKPKKEDDAEEKPKAKAKKK